MSGSGSSAVKTYPVQTYRLYYIQTLETAVESKEDSVAMKTFCFYCIEKKKNREIKSG